MRRGNTKVTHTQDIECSVPLARGSCPSGASEFDGGGSPCPYGFRFTFRLDIRPPHGSLSRHGRHRGNVLRLRPARRDQRRGFDRQDPIDPGRSVARDRGRRRIAARRRRAGGRHRLFLPRHDGRHQRAARRQGRPDRVAGDGRISRHLSGRRTGAPLRRRHLRRHVRQAGAAGARKPDRRGEGARRFPGQRIAAARRGGAARQRARAQGTGPGIDRGLPAVFLSASGARATRARDPAGRSRTARSRSRARCCRRSASITG
jgi:hypothetical protein